jgi:hypothetical protein
MTMMRAVSVLQPWAWLIVNGFKPIENRSWSLSYRGPLVIHAGQQLGQAQLNDYEWVQHHFTDIRMPPIRDMRGGGIVGQVRLVDCVTASDSPWFQGKFGWVLAEPRRAQFVPFKGKLGLFPVTADKVVLVP